jgi:hypothetical protein
LFVDEVVAMLNMLSEIYPEYCTKNTSEFGTLIKINRAVSNADVKERIEESKEEVKRSDKFR